MEAHKKSEIRQILEEFDNEMKKLIDTWVDEQEAKAKVTSMQRDKYNKIWNSQ